MHSRYGGSSGFGAFLCALLLAIIPAVGACVCDGVVNVPAALQPLVWTALDLGQREGWWVLWSVDGETYLTTISMRYIRIEMVHEAEW